MSQALLPIIPDGSSKISDLISVVRHDTGWTYFCGVQPIFAHPERDRQSFRMFTAQLCCQGVCTQAQIMRTFGVSKNSVLRSAAKYRREGVNGFYRPRRGRGPTVLTAQIRASAQGLLELGYSRREAADELGVNCDTIRKAIDQGRLRLPTSAPATRWESPARVRPNASWRLSVNCPAARRRSSKPVATSPAAGFFALCRRWRKQGFSVT